MTKKSSALDMLSYAAHTPMGHLLQLTRQSSPLRNVLIKPPYARPCSATVWPRYSTDQLRQQDPQVYTHAQVRPCLWTRGLFAQVPQHPGPTEEFHLD